MAKTYHRKQKLRMDSPARYQILVQGGLDDTWSGRLGGLDISVYATGQGDLVTQLSGRLVDQAALFGTLNTLYELRLPLISVAQLSADDEGSSA